MVSSENKGRETGTVLSRTLTCSIRGSLNQFTHGGQEAACWSTQNGRINDILGVTELLDSAADQASAAALIKTAYLHKVTVLEYLNGFPLPLGVSISCVPSRECTRTGVAYAFSTLPEVCVFITAVPITKLFAELVCPSRERSRTRHPGPLIANCKIVSLVSKLRVLSLN